MIRLSAFAMKDNPLDAAGERGCIVNTSAVSAFEGRCTAAALGVCLYAT